MRHALSRLRWQLTISHLAAIAVTLVAMIGALLLIASAWWSHVDNPTYAPVTQARLVANNLQARIVRDRSSGTQTSELSGDLAQLVSGDIRLGGASVWGSPESNGDYTSLDQLAYVVIATPDGGLLASSDATGASFAPPDRREWEPLLDVAFAGVTDPSRLLLLDREGGPDAYGAYPVLDASGRPEAAVLVAAKTRPSPNTGWNLGHALLFFGAASVVVLVGASAFALASSSLVGYLLARRLVRRLERLGRATEAFASGDLSQRVKPEADDEVARLAHRFNAMADRLSETLSELAREKGLVEGALQAKRELVANVSHELRTPLASIRAHTESLLLPGDFNPDVVHRYLAVIHRQTEQLSRLIDDLFVLSTSESGALALAVRPVDLGSIIEEVVGSIQPAAHAERRVSIVSDIDSAVPQVLADRQRVAQVLANLLRNAIRYTPEGGLVAVCATLSDSQFALVSVEDTGAGIPSEALQHIFDRFYRADPSRDRASGGAGLGLAIVRELVTGMGGEVSAESVVGEGSRFAFTLPLAGRQTATGSHDRERSPHGGTLARSW
jgi:signal transduction histidine kinase